MNTGFLGTAVATVLTVYGIETINPFLMYFIHRTVATVLTVYGIETYDPKIILGLVFKRRLQQYLPFTVLKPLNQVLVPHQVPIQLQQYLPFTVLKLSFSNSKGGELVATVLTVYGIETL